MGTNEQHRSEQNQPHLAHKNVADHLANERTFLAWVRTGLATITFGFVVARFGLFLRELGIKTKTLTESSEHFSSFIGIALILLGVGVIAAAWGHFRHVGQAIDTAQFSPKNAFMLVLTILAGSIGLLLAAYLFLTIY